MRTLILRTIAHSRVWEGDRPRCFYDGRSYETINTWEPDLSIYTIEEIQYGIGIYASPYYTYKSYSGVIACTGTEEENKPSLLQLNPIDHGDNRFSKDNGSRIDINFSFIGKYLSFNRETMAALDSRLIESKYEELEQNPPDTPFPSLCFTLEQNKVEIIFEQFGVNMYL